MVVSSDAHLIPPAHLRLNRRRGVPVAEPSLRFLHSEAAVFGLQSFACSLVHRLDPVKHMRGPKTRDERLKTATASA